jgi:hypothetical protein
MPLNPAQIEVDQVWRDKLRDRTITILDVIGLHAFYRSSLGATHWITQEAIRNRFEFVEGVNPCR